MPIRRKLEVAGVFQPEEMDLLTRVFEATCPSFENVGDREQRASRIIAKNYQLEIQDERELIELSRLPLGRAEAAGAWFVTVPDGTEEDHGWLFSAIPGWIPAGVDGSWVDDKMLFG